MSIDHYSAMFPKQTRRLKVVRALWAVVALVAFAISASAEDYPWAEVFSKADHACIVENSTGLFPEQTVAQQAVFDWNDSPKSFKLEVYWCPSTFEEVKDKCTDRMGWVIRTPRLSGKTHPGWSSSETDFFSSELGETFFVSDGGRFDYSQLNVTKPGDTIAWFTMTGTCTPFDE